MFFRRRPPQAQLIVTTNVMRRVQSHMPAPQAPSIPLSDAAARAGAVPQADVITAVRNSGVVIAFLAGGGGRAHLTTRVYDVIASADGCGLGRSANLSEFAEEYCDSADDKRRLVHALAVHRPSTNPTALLTRMAITAWVRTVGLAAHSRAMTEAEGSGLPEWHTPGDM